LGDYRFTPQELAVPTGRTLRLELTNTDGITPHNFTLKNPASGLDIDTDVPPGATRVVELTPKRPGSYAFYCNKKLPFMKSHRERGMQGTLTVLPAD
jgi:heme/copper-type cytochrome/quinol oxidase subunit 2